jgi:hypothetical protein
VVFAGHGLLASEKRVTNHLEGALRYILSGLDAIHWELDENNMKVK